MKKPLEDRYPALYARIEPYDGDFITSMERRYVFDTMIYWMKI